MPHVIDLIKNNQYSRVCDKLNIRELKIQSKNKHLYFHLPKNQNLKANLIFDNLDKKITFIGFNQKLYGLNLGDAKLNEIKKQNSQCNKCKTRVTHIHIQLLKDGNCKITKYITNNGKLTKDHIFPKSFGGLLVNYNKQYLCSKCNSKKGNKLLETFKEQPVDFILGFLESFYVRLKYKINMLKYQMEKL